MSQKPRDLTKRQKIWQVIAIAHVIPMNDLIEHAITGYGCACNAEIEPVDDGFLIKHRALDGRKDPNDQASVSDDNK